MILGHWEKTEQEGGKASSTFQLLSKIVFESRVQGYTVGLARGLPASFGTQNKQITA